MSRCCIGVDDDGDPAEIEEFRFRNSDFPYVELHAQIHTNTCKAVGRLAQVFSLSVLVG